MKLQILTLILVLLSTTPFFAQTPQTTETIKWEDVFSLPKDQSRIERIEGKVVGVHDGDTCTVLDKDKNQYKIRFDGIDAPELKQDFGNRAKQNLSDLIFGKEVTVLSTKQDKYGRTVGKVLLEGKDINYIQVLFGYAWHYKKYQEEQSPEDRKNYSEAEIKARASKAGMWTQANNIIPPWDYRAGIKERQAEEKANRKYLTGPRGGCYYINSNGNKTSVDRKFCGADSDKSDSKSENTTTGNDRDNTTTPANNSTRTYLKGPKGGCYYINSSGKKTYVDKEKCGQ